MKVDLVATERHYVEHLLPVWERLGELQGRMFLGGRLPEAFGGEGLRGLEPGDDLILVAGYSDLQRVGGRRAVLMEHGAGQSYGGDPGDPVARHSHYAGGNGRHNVVAFLCPNEHSAQRNREAYPDAIVEVIGSPHLASLQGLERRPGDGRVTVAFAFHYDLQLCTETMNAWDAFWPAVVALHRNDELEVLGHAHPRLYRDVAPTYGEWGVEAVESWPEIVQRADVLVCDNSSVGFEFASLVGPVVWMDPPWYRRSVDHGLRFWDAASSGVRVSDPAAVALALEPALAGVPGLDAALELVFPSVEDPAARAVEAIERACLESDRVPARGITAHMAAALRRA